MGVEALDWFSNTRKKCKITKKPKRSLGTLDGTPRRRTRQRKWTMNFATWNIQGIRLKKDIIASEIQKLNIDLVALTETKKKGSGTENVGEYIHLFTGVSKEMRAARGVSILIRKNWKNKINNWEAIDENILTVNLKLYGYNITIIAAYAPSDDERVDIKQEFFDKLDEILVDSGRNREIILLGDFNGRTGRTNNSPVVGPFGEETINDNGQRLVHLCETHNLRINNGFFKHKDIHRYTWIQNTRNLKTIIDYVISKQETNIEINDVRVLRGINCGSDHFLVRAKIRMQFRKMNRNQGEQNSNAILRDTVDTTKYNFDSFKDESTVFLYQRRLNSKLLNPEECTFNQLYENIIRSLIEATQEAIGTKENNTNKKYWWNEEIELLVQEKKQKYLKWLTTKNEEDLEAYKDIKRQLRTCITIAKNESWDRKCEEINNYIGGRKCSEVWRFISNVKNQGKDRANIQVIKPEQWVEHYKGLLQETRQEYIIDSPRHIQVQGEEVQISEGTVKKTIKNLKSGKASGPEGIYSEMLKWGTEKLFRNLTLIINKCLNGHPVPQDWKTAFISSIHKKGNKLDCNNYRGISVTSTLSRLYGRILRDLIEEDYKEKEEEEQCGFRAGRSCTDNVFCLKQVIEKRAARHLETHLTFVDLQKAYDTVPVSRLWKVLEQSNINHNYISALKELYKDSKSRIKIGTKLTDTFIVNKGLRQGCCISPTLFKIYVAVALKNWKRKIHGMGIEIDDRCLFTLQFADDQVIVANDQEDMQYMSRKLIEEYRKWGLTVNINKTKYLCVGTQSGNLELDNGQEILQCQEYEYLGITFDSTGTDVKEIEKRIVKAKKVIGCLNGILWSKEITKRRKFNIYETMIKSSLLYGAETWRITDRQKRKVEAVEMDAIRRSMRVSRRERIRNDHIKQQMGIEGTIVQDIEKKQLTWYGHVERMPNTRWPKKVLHWQPTGRRKRGRPKLEWQKTIQKSMSERNLSAEDCNDRRGWKLGVGQRRRTF